MALVEPPTAPLELTAGAATVTCWGTGRPMREFLYADDLARACIFKLRPKTAAVDIGRQR